jgi:hypothetical protein
MTKFTEGRHPGEGLMSEANFHRSRGVATIASGTGVVVPGTVLGKITSGGKYTISPNAEVEDLEGAETGVAIALYGCDATSADQDITIIARDAEWNVNTRAALPGGAVACHIAIARRNPRCSTSSTRTPSALPR